MLQVMGICVRCWCIMAKHLNGSSLFLVWSNRSGQLLCSRQDPVCPWKETSPQKWGVGTGCYLFTVLNPNLLFSYSWPSQQLLKSTTAITILRPFFQDHLGEPMPEENFWTLWCKGRLTEADTQTIRLGAMPSRLTIAHLRLPPYFFMGRMPFLPPNQQCQSTEGN